MIDRSDLIAKEPIRMLVVDDSVVFRKLVRMAFEDDREFELVGFAPNGMAALRLVGEVRPQVVTLDIEMPGMDGLQTLDRLKADHPDIKVVMFSSLTAHGARKTLEALSRGADDYVPKPVGAGSLIESMKSLQQELGPKVKQLLQRQQPDLPAPVTESSNNRTSNVDIVAIGVSTGGPNALADIIPQLPGNFPCPIVITQHMPEVFTKLLAERLDAESKLSVEEAEEGSVVEPGKVLIAPGGRHLRFRREGTLIVVGLDDSPDENSCKPAVDVMFRSVRDVWGSRALAVMLTGMGQDGLLGVEALKKVGASVLAQDRETSVVWGMPGQIVSAGLADQVIPLYRIANAIQYSCREPKR